ncbi:MAG: hypothetical protein OXN90_02760 [Gemmatimonadota bacterium]|nr:hypothetical protein [Gemmatimonadota bacterium]
MQVHADILNILKKEILPCVIQIHDFDVPWPAKLQSGSAFLGHEHENGVVMFNIGNDGYLNAEYFSHDGSGPLIFGEGKLIMRDTQVEISNRVLGLNPKVEEYFHDSMPKMTAYNLLISGWIVGSLRAKIRAARMTLLDMPNLHLPQLEPSVSNENHLIPTFTRQNNTGRYAVEHSRHPILGLTSKNVILEIGPGDWSVQLMESNFNLSQETGPLYHVTLAKGDRSPFTLSDERIGNALYKFLSFQARRWITTPTIVCDPSDTDNQITKYGCVGRLTSNITQLAESRKPATIWQKWPNLFQEFLRQYNDPDSREHLRNAVYHYVEANQVLDDAAVGQALVAAQATLQALTRWWNELEIDFKFGRRNGPTFEQLLIKAVQQAKLGKDSGAVVDEKALQSTIREAVGYRNDIDHGRGGVVAEHRRRVGELQRHHQNLARLLILAKLGDRDRDTSGHFAGPKFK